MEEQGVGGGEDDREFPHARGRYIEMAWVILVVAVCIFGKLQKGHLEERNRRHTQTLCLSPWE